MTFKVKTKGQIEGEELLVPKLRFKEFNSEYQKYKIGDTLKVKSGKDQKSIECINGTYPILGTGGQIGTTNSFLYDKPSVLIGRKGTINKPQYMTAPFWTVDTLFYTDIKEEFNTKYIFYAFQNINWKKYDESTGVPSLSCKTIEEILYYIPNKDEQDKISTFITLLDKKIELQQRKIETLKIYKKGLVSHIFKNISSTKKLKNIVTFQNGIGYENLVDVTGNYNLISLNSITIDGKLNKFMKKIKSDLPVSTLKKNDIVIIMSDVGHGDFLGVSAIIPDDNKYVLNQRVGLLRITDNTIPQYLLYAINNLQSYFKKYGQGSSQLNLSKGDILNVNIPYIDIYSQKKLSDFFILFDKKISSANFKLENLKSLRKSLLQQMFI